MYFLSKGLLIVRRLDLFLLIFSCLIWFFCSSSVRTLDLFCRSRWCFKLVLGPKAWLQGRCSGSFFEFAWRLLGEVSYLRVFSQICSLNVVFLRGLAFFWEVFQGMSLWFWWVVRFFDNCKLVHIIRFQFSMGLHLKEVKRNDPGKHLAFVVGTLFLIKGMSPGTKKLYGKKSPFQSHLKFGVKRKNRIYQRTTIGFLLWEAQGKEITQQPSQKPSKGTPKSAKKNLETTNED